MKKLLLAIAMLTAAVAVDAEAWAGRRTGNCRSGRCERVERGCKTRRCGPKACPVKCARKVYQEEPEEYCVTEEYCKAVPTVKVVPDTKYVKVKCVSNVTKKCCIDEGEPCDPATAAQMTNIEEAPAHVQNAVQKAAKQPAMTYTK